MNERLTAKTSLRDDLQNIDLGELSLLQSNDSENVKALIKNLSPATQTDICKDHALEKIRTTASSALFEGGLKRLVQEQPQVLLSEEFARDVLTHLNRGTITRTEAGEIFQLVSTFESTSRLPDASVQIVECNPNDPEGIFMRQFGYKLTDEQLQSFREGLTGLPRERQVLIVFEPNFSNTSEQEIDKKSLYFIGKGLEWKGESWVTFEQETVKSITLMPIGLFNLYSRSRFGEDSLDVVPEFGISSSDDLSAQILKGEHGVIVGNPFEPDSVVHGYVAGALALHIHDYYHHLNRCLLAPDIRTEIITFSEELRQQMMGLNFDESSHAQNLLSSTSEFSEEEMRLATHVTDLARIIHEPAPPEGLRH